MRRSGCSIGLISPLRNGEAKSGNCLLKSLSLLLELRLDVLLCWPARLIGLPWALPRGLTVLRANWFSKAVSVGIMMADRVSVSTATAKAATNEVVANFFIVNIFIV